MYWFYTSFVGYIHETFLIIKCLEAILSCKSKSHENFKEVSLQILTQQWKQSVATVTTFKQFLNVLFTVMKDSNKN